MAHPRSWRVPLGAATSRRTPGDCEVAGRGHPHGGILGTRSTVSPASQTPHTSNGVCVRAAWVRMVCARPRGGCQGVGNQRPGAPLAESAEGHPARPNRSGMPLSASGCPVVCDFKPPRQRPAACWAHTHEAPRSELALGRHQKITAHSLGHHPCGLVGEARLASNRRAGFTFEGRSDMGAPRHMFDGVERQGARLPGWRGGVMNSGTRSTLHQAPRCTPPGIGRTRSPMPGMCMAKPVGDRWDPRQGRTPPSSR